MKIVLLILGIYFLYIAITKIISINKRNNIKNIEKNLEESIKGLIKNSMLPLEKNPSIYLKDNEYQIYNCESILYEERTSRYWQGLSLRVFKGFYYRFGKSMGFSEIRKLDTGKLIITTERIVFLGTINTKEVYLNKIISIKQNISRVTINCEGRIRSLIFLPLTPNVVYLLIDTLRNNVYVKNPNNNLGEFLIEKYNYEKFKSTLNIINDKSQSEVSDINFKNGDKLYDDTISDQTLFEKYSNNQKDNFIPIIKYDQSQLKIAEYPIFLDYGKLYIVDNENVVFESNIEVDKNELKFLCNIDILLTNLGIYIIGNKKDYYEFNHITYTEIFTNSLMIITKYSKPFMLFINYPKTFNSLINYITKNQPLKRFHTNSLTIENNILPDTLVSDITLIPREEWNRKYILSNEFYTKKDYKNTIHILQNLIWSTADKHDFFNLCINMSLCLFNSSNFVESKKYLDLARFVDPNNLRVNKMSIELDKFLSEE
jgi:hypothetical protein